MIHTDKIVVVEGVYDKHTLSNFLDATVIDVGGFKIFKDEATAKMLRSLAEKRGVIILTDSDRAGFIIRDYLTQYIGKEYVTQVYIPDVFGKERRKQKPSKENKLGVEGMSEDMIVKAFETAGVFTEKRSKAVFLTKADMYFYGLSGAPDSVAKRKAIAKKLSLPENISANKLLDIINVCIDREGLEKLLSEL